MASFDEIFGDLTQIPEGYEYGDLPQLDFDSSTLQSSAPSVDPTISVAPPLQLNGSPSPSGYDSVLPLREVESENDNKEIMSMLRAISSRLTDLELGVSAGNAQINQMGFNLDMALPIILGMAEEFRSAIGSLKESLKSFSRGLINHLLNCRIEGDVETAY